MAVDRRLAAVDLRDKIALENDIAARLRRLNAQILSRYARRLGIAGEVIDIPAEFGEPLTDLLLTHYGRVVAIFGRRSNRLLPDELQLTDEERVKLGVALDGLTSARAPEQAARILATTQAQAFQALMQAQADAVERTLAGEPMSSRDIAMVAAAILRRRLLGRVTGISILETQIIAEAAKQVELQVLLDQEPFTEPETRARFGATVKEWVSQGDSLVRDGPVFNHLDADSIQVPVEEPFVVSGQLLMHPGDTSLGATMGNVAGCRCSSVPDLASVASARQDIVGIDNTRFPLISLVDDAINALLQ